MAVNELFDTGIKITGSFSAAGAFPADAKSVVNTIAERDDHVTQNRAYDGMEVYVKELEKKYRYVSGEWVELDIEYAHPVYDNQSTNLYKIEVESGHIKSATEATKQDILDLGFVEVGIARYGRTTYNDLLAMYSPTKTIELIIMNGTDVNISGDNTLVSLRATLTKETQTEFIFTTVDITGIHQFICHYINGWSYSLKSFITTTDTNSFLADADGNIVVDSDGVTVTAN